MQGFVAFRASSAYKMMCRKRYQIHLRHRKTQKGLFATEKQGCMPAGIDISKGIPFATRNSLEGGVSWQQKNSGMFV